MDIKKEFSENQTILLIMSSVDYNKEIVKIVKKLSKKKITYVTLNKTRDALVELFKKNKIDTKNIVFIDAISRTIKNVPEHQEGAYYISSPAAITELSLAISQVLEKNFDCLIFDSLTSMLVYERKAPVSRFVSTLINRIKQSHTNAVFYAIAVGEQDSLIAESGMFVDKVVYVNGSSIKSKGRK